MESGENNPAGPRSGDPAIGADGAEPGSRASGRRAVATRITPLGVISIAVLLLLLVSEFVVTGDFFSRSTMSTLLAPVAILIIIAIGQAFVVGTGGIDLSVAPTVTLMGVIVLKASGGKDSGLLEALLLCIAVCVIIGLVNGVLVEGLRLNALVVTLATGQLILGFMRLYGGAILPTADVPPQLADWTQADIAGGVSYLLLIAVVVTLLGTVFLHRVVYGRRFVASSASERAAFLAGLKARWYRILAYVVASLTYGFGGVLAAGQIRTPDATLGDPYLLLSIVAVVLGGAAVAGGRVSPLATMLGAVFIIVLDYDLRVEGLSPGVRQVVQGAVLVLGLSLVALIEHLPKLKVALRNLWRGASARRQRTTA